MKPGNALALVAIVLTALNWNAAPRPAAVASQPLSAARITVDTKAELGSISDLIYGVGLEWTENGNRILDPQSGELRREMIDGLKPLRIPVFRFPGGILADHYNWRDGVGPRESRPKRRNPMDGSEHENNFGTDEFIQLCRALGSDALITANMGTGDLRSAVEWQRYFQDQGFPVKYWEIGNEIYLAEPKSRASIPGNDQRIYKTAGQYSDSFRDWARALRSGFPSAFVGAIAGTYNTSRQNQGWLDTLTARTSSDADFVALHNSFAPLILKRYDYEDESKRTIAYRAMYAHTLAAAEDIAKVRALFGQRRAQPIRIAITEHFPLFGGGGSERQMRMILDQSRTLAAAVFTAGLLQMYMREGVWMANYNLATSKWFGALLTDTEQGIVRTPTWHIYNLYRNHFGSTLLKTTVASPEYSTEQVGIVQPSERVPFLDAVASRDRQGRTYLAVINRHESTAIEAEVTVAGVAPAAETFSVAGRAPNGINGPSLSGSTVSNAEIAVRQSTWNGEGKYRFPPTSVTVFSWKSLTESKHAPSGR